jgi:methionine-rich copper-binding protein CopC
MEAKLVKVLIEAVTTFFAIAALAIQTPALASNLVESTPEANAIVTQGAEVGPQIDLRFSEPISLNLSNFVVVGPRGHHLTTTIGQDLNDKSLVFVSIWDQIVPGKYTVLWQTASSGNGTGSHGSYVFTVKYARAADKPK